MRYVYTLSLALLLAFSVGAPSLNAQTTSTSAALEVQIADLLKQVATLQAQLKTLQNTNANLESEVGKLKLQAKLNVGSSGEDVRLLQELLATDATIYPEGLVTGFFGSLTENAVKRFQAKLKLEQVGSVGPETLARINEILAAAGVTQDIPANLLGSRVKIQVEIKDGKQEVQIEVKCDSSGSGNSCNEGEDEEDDDDADEDEDEDESDDEDDDSDDDADEDESDEDED